MSPYAVWCYIFATSILCTQIWNETPLWSKRNMLMQSKHLFILQHIRCTQYKRCWVCACALFMSECIVSKMRCCIHFSQCRSSHTIIVSNCHAVRAAYDKYRAIYSKYKWNVIKIDNFRLFKICCGGMFHKIWIYYLCKFIWTAAAFWWFRANIKTSIISFSMSC